MDLVTIWHHQQSNISFDGAQFSPFHITKWDHNCQSLPTANFISLYSIFPCGILKQRINCICMQDDVRNGLASISDQFQLSCLTWKYISTIDIYDKKNKLHLSHSFLLIALFHTQKNDHLCRNYETEKWQPDEEPIRIKEHDFLITRLNDSNYGHFLTVFFFQINSIRSLLFSPSFLSGTIA